MAEENEFDLLTVESGAITAPAGCGKTHLISDALKRHVGKKPILVLTHTNAGVVALRSRLQRAHVNSSNYTVTTIDGWAMKLVSTFPTRSKIAAQILKLENPATDYPSIRKGAIEILSNGHISEILKASYTRLIVDEYQDCSALQHKIVSLLSEVLTVCVLGDPLQAIFGFGADPLAGWDDEVCDQFPHLGQLKIPWRWKNVGMEPLGHWLLEVRNSLVGGKSIDLSTAPKEVTWIQLDGGKEDFKKLLDAAATKPPIEGESVLIIGDSMRVDSRHQIASAVHGATTVETVDLKDFVQFAQKFKLEAPNAIEKIANFAQSVMTNVGAKDLLQRIEIIREGRARKPPTDLEKIALKFVEEPSFKEMANLLEAISSDTGVRTFRPAVLRNCYKALQLCISNQEISFYEATLKMREQNRVLGRPIPKRAVGSTLLLKGLEAEVAVVLNADSLDAKNLYVAMTRGSKRLVICSASQTLRPTSSRK